MVHGEMGYWSASGRENRTRSKTGNERDVQRRAHTYYGSLVAEFPYCAGFKKPERSDSGTDIDPKAGRCTV